MEENEEVNYRKAVDDTVDHLRADIKEVARKVKALTESLKAAPKANDPGRVAMDSEVIAQSILSYRHLEDASMRLGKVKQYNNEGESVYDKNVVGSK